MDTGVLNDRSTNLIPTNALLDTWTTRDWSDGVRVDRLATLDRLLLTTLNNVYELIVMTPSTAEVMVRGGAFFPDFTRARVAGSSLGGSFLKLHTIHHGFRLELTDGSRTILTSPVRHIELAPADPSALPM